MNFNKIPTKFVPKGPVNNIPALVQIMVWCPPDDNPSYEPMMLGLSTYIYVTRPQWVNLLDPNKEYTNTSRLYIDHTNVFKNFVWKWQPFSQQPMSKTYCDMATWIRLSKWLVNKLNLHITWTNVDLSSKVFCGILLMVILQETLKIYIFDLSLITINFRITVTSPGD